jgi:hypothetical protein
MREARDGHSTTLLYDGRVLVVGGRAPDGRVLDSVEVWDPAEGVFREAARVAMPVANHTAVLLEEGLVLIVPDGLGPDGVMEPFLYEPEVIE